MTARGDADGGSYVAGRQPVLELLRAGRGAERVLIADSTRRAGVISEIDEAAVAAGVPVRSVPKAELDRVAQGVNHQGVVAVTGRFRYAPLESMLAAADPAILYLDGVMDPHNLGSLLRSADGAGLDGVVIPARRAVGVTPAVRRVSAGASEVVPVARISDLVGGLEQAKKAGLWVVGFDMGATEAIWDSNLMERPVALVLGSEDRGISRSVRGVCDGFVRIPSAGRLDSLNVAVAGAIAMFEVARRGAPSDIV